MSKILRFTGIIMLLMLNCSLIKASDDIIDKICREYEECHYWGYDMSNCTTLSPWEYWNSWKNWEQGRFIDMDSETNEDTKKAYIVKIDDVTVELHNVLQNYSEVFNDGFDYVLRGIVNEEEDMLIIPVQEVKKGLIFGSTTKYGPEGVNLEDLEPLEVEMAIASTVVNLSTVGYPMVDVSFAIYSQCDDAEGMYASLGNCCFDLFTRVDQILYVFNPTSFTPNCQETQSSLSEIVIGFENVPSINPAFENSIKVTKDNQPYDAEYLIRHTGEYLSTVTFEFIDPITDAGEYSITFPKELFWTGQNQNFSSGYTNPEFTLTYTIGDGTGIAGVQTGNDADAMLYDLQGVKVDGKSAKTGVYIRKTGNKTEKVYIR